MKEEKKIPDKHQVMVTEIVWGRHVTRLLEIIQQDCVAAAPALPFGYMLIFRDDSPEESIFHYRVRVAGSDHSDLEEIMEKVFTEWMQKKFGNFTPADEYPKFKQ